MDKNNKFVYVYDNEYWRSNMIIGPFFDPGLWLLGYDYAILNYKRWNYASLAAPFWRVYWNNTTGAVSRRCRSVLTIYMSFHPTWTSGQAIMETAGSYIFTFRSAILTRLADRQSLHCR